MASLPREVVSSKTAMLSKEQADSQRGWVIVDAAGVPLGRLATQVAYLIRGKNKPNFTAHVDGGDFVIVLNAEKVVLTGRKLTDKMYHRHTGYAGGLKSESAGSLMKRMPERVVRQAIEGMLPTGVLAHRMLKKLKIFKGGEHTHHAQQPVVVAVTESQK